VINKKSTLVVIIIFVFCALFMSACSISDLGEVISQPFEDMVSGLMGMLSGLGKSMRQMFEGFSSPF